MFNLLRRLRILLAALCFIGLCLLFVDVSGLLRSHLAFLARIQLVPALLSGSLFIVGTLLVLTLLFGRLYCSVICPLGVLQDSIHRCNTKHRHHFTPAATRFRVLALVVFAAAFAVGIPLLFGLLEPYSLFGRMASTLLEPFWATGNNVLALGAERMGSVAVAAVPVWQKGLSVLVVAVLSLLVIGRLAWKHGRTWCNTICPVGTLLGFVSRFSLLRPRIDAAKCVNCGRCAAQCKASCLDVATHSIDASRCVTCFNCLSVCRKGALSYGLPLRRATKPPSDKEEPQSIPGENVPGEKTDISRRALLLAATAFVGASGTALAETPSIPALTRKLRPARSVPVTPPGSQSVRAFAARCTGCQLCVTACPHQALQAFDTGPGMLQPSLSFEHGYCRVNCVACTDVCPTGAIQPLTSSRKSALQIGRAVVRPERCIITTDGVPCTACSRNCPAGAIRLVGDPRMPAVDAERCTGCGACEYYCPSRPYAAIQVEGNHVHRPI